MCELLGIMFNVMVVCGLVVVRGRSDRISVVIEMDQEVSIWLAVSGVCNYCRVVEDNRSMQWMGVSLLCC